MATTPQLRSVGGTNLQDEEAHLLACITEQTRDFQGWRYSFREGRPEKRMTAEVITTLQTKRRNKKGK
eukprot:10978511-Prorocentrum_lima.AAC.1